MKAKRKKTVVQLKTLILSDVHLGTEHCQIDKVNFLLKHTDCDKLILNGDIIDGWALGRRGGWTRQHTRFIRLVLKKMEKRGTEVIYLRGNHDDILDRFLPLRFDKLRVVDRHIHETAHGPYLVVHGDVFDVVTQNSKLVAVAGDIGYKMLLRSNRVYNRLRKLCGKPPFSLSKLVKAKTKSVVNYISRFEENVERFTKREGCVGFICGHIHTPDDKQIGTVHYLNSGDWVESATAILEHPDGRLELIGFDAFVDRLAELEHHELIRENQVRFPLPA